jgi:hypothetical protein
MEEFDNYYEFLVYNKEDVVKLNEKERKVLTMLSQELLNGKRLQEVLLLKALINKSELSIKDYKEQLRINKIPFSNDTIKSVTRILNLDFFVEQATTKYGKQEIVILEDEKFKLSKEIIRSLKNDFYRSLLLDVLDVAIERSKKYNQSNPFTLFEKYSRKDACRLLNWDNDESATIYGYKVKHSSCPIFVTYHKHDEVEASVNYGDEFLSNQVFKWYTRNKRNLESKEVVEIINSNVNGNKLHLFIKREDGEGTDFYYLGQVSVIDGSPIQTTMPDKTGKNLSVVTLEFLLPEPVENNLYNYLISNG